MTGVMSARPPIGEQWVKIHNEVAAAHYHEALRICHNVKGMCPKIERFFDMHEQEDKKMNVGTPELYRCAIDIACDLALDLGPAGIEIMENRLAEMDEKHHFSCYEKTGAARWLVLGEAKQKERPVRLDSRYAWCTVFAHLWVVSDSIAARSYESDSERTQAVIDATFVCAEFTGHHQKTFCYILLTLNMLVAFLPAPLTHLLRRFIEELDGPRYNGVFPAEFIHPRV